MIRSILLLGGLAAFSLGSWAQEAPATEALQPQSLGERIYRANCASCHDTGELGAPKIGDHKAWRPRIAEGRRMQVRMAIRGIRKMPPRGGNPNLSDQEVEAAVIYLLNQSGARFKS